MKKDQIVTLKSVLAGEEFALATLHPSVFACLAERIEDAVMSSSKAGLDTLSRHLDILVGAQFRQVDQDMMLAIQQMFGRGDPQSKKIIGAYHLGMFSFAQLLAANMRSHRADDDFLPELKRREYALYLKTLLHGRCSLSGLAKKAKENKNTTHQKMGKLRVLGAVESCMQGGDEQYFLTPVAEQYLKSKK